MHERITALTAELADRDRTIAELKQLLRKLEWEGGIHSTFNPRPCCPDCRVYQYIDHHAEDCALAAALKE
jgi:hypothetical protein